ncbi:spore coat protein [Aquibacillus sediminis]|uniref:spore coat protein n=1 Tax=Aquibacillus sediminis TaxID=2574734 RepID=UPI0011080B88|nr:spore coat protein [Aquibacillus sediminis]
MNPFLEKLTGMAPLTDQVIATDILVAAKAEIKNYAVAITETSTPEIRNVLTKQLEDAISFHEQIANYMIENGFYYPKDAAKQLQLDMETAQKALNIAQD